MAKKKVDAIKLDANKKVITLNVPRSELSGDDLLMYQDLIAAGWTPKVKKPRTAKQNNGAIKQGKHKEDYLAELSTKSERDTFEKKIAEGSFFTAVMWFNEHKKEAK